MLFGSKEFKTVKIILYRHVNYHNVYGALFRDPPKVEIC